MSIVCSQESIRQNSELINIESNSETFLLDNINNYNSLSNIGSIIIMGVQEISSENEESINIGTSEEGIIVDQNSFVNDSNAEDSILSKAGSLYNLTYDVCSGLTLVKDCKIDLNSSHVANENQDNLIIPQASSSTCTNGELKENRASECFWDDVLILNEGLVNSKVGPKDIAYSEPSTCVTLELDQSTVPFTKDLDSKPAPNVLRKFPLVKISKDCLLKGKIIGKSDLASLLSNDKACSFLSLPSENPNPANLKEIESGSVIGNHNLEENVPQSLIVDLKDQIQSEAELTEVNRVKFVKKVSKVRNGKKLKKPLFVTVSSSSVPKQLLEISNNKTTNQSSKICIMPDHGDNIMFQEKTIVVQDGSSDVIVMSDSKQDKSDDNYDQAAVDLLFISLLGVTGDVLERFEATVGSLPLHCPIEGCVYTNMKGSCLKLHMLQHFGVRPYRCDFPGCTWAFYTKFKLQRHRSVHSSNNEFKCTKEKCGRTFSTIYNLNTHLKLHQRPFSISCNIDSCSKTFQTHNSYERHLREHGIEHAPYKCEKCDKRYFTINSLNSHSRIHQHKIESLQCTVCGKRFEQPCRLKAHLHIHTGTKPFKCAVCPWAFTTSSKLRRHERKHNQNRKFECAICGKNYLRAEHLKDHSLNHFVKKSFVCPEPSCNAVMSTKSSMYTHLKKHRIGQVKTVTTNIIPCPVLGCDFSFDSKDRLQTHLLDDHGAKDEPAREALNNAENIESEENLSTFEGLEDNNTSSSGTKIVSFNSITQEGLLVGMSDIVQCIPPINQGELSESNSSGNEDNLLEESIDLTEIEEDIGSGSSGLVFEALCDPKEDPLAPSHTPIPTTPRHTASDVVLSAASENTFLQDELSEGDLYMGAEDGLGELQVLLLDPATRMQHSDDFEQSTINLRDLE